MDSEEVQRLRSEVVEWKEEVGHVSFRDHLIRIASFHLHFSYGLLLFICIFLKYRFFQYSITSPRESAAIIELLFQVNT